jgi:PTH1 family peptidyl-tRNA hydrolase
VIRLVIGLGNDSEKYKHTLHNIGFLTVDSLGTDQISGDPDFVFSKMSSSDVRLIKACSLMNVCGSPIAAALRWFKVAPQDILVVVDEFALPWGRLRFRLSGSAGGHNGMKSVIEALGTEDFPRLRVGVGPVPERIDSADFVLKKRGEKELIPLAQKAAEAVQVAVSDGLEKAMNQFNGVPL